MIKLLTRIFIKKDPTDPEARGAFGTMCSIVGIILNVLLFLGKITVGTLCSSVAISADAVNNLSDAGSSLITLAGFRIAEKKPDKDHPYGHGRAEYIAGAAVSVMIVLVGLSLAKDSVIKIMHPEDTVLSAPAMCVLICSVLVKAYMFSYNRTGGVRIGSGAMLAAARDSLSDAAATGAVTVCYAAEYITGLHLDGICGLLVSAFILYTGIGSVRETVAPLLGSPPAPDLVKEIENIVMSHDFILGMHDLTVHDYGPGTLMISLHAEVDGKGDIFELHDGIDLIERELSSALGCTAVIHMDPIVTDDCRISEMRTAVAKVVSQLGDGVSIHDFRMVSGPTHTNVIFDAVVPYESGLDDVQARKKIEKLIHDTFPDTFAVVDIDRPYAG